MILKAKLPKTAPLTIQWLFILWLIYVLIFTIFRDIYCFFIQAGQHPFSSLLPSFWLGFRFDAKWISMILLPIAMLSVYPKFSPFFSEMK